MGGSGLLTKEQALYSDMLKLNNMLNPEPKPKPAVIRTLTLTLC